MKNPVYIAIDLKSFFASVECVERNLDPLTTNLVVADASRTEKTICLAVSPSLKAYGISGRARLFEVVERVREVNAQRLRHIPGHTFKGSSWRDPEVQKDGSVALDYIIAPPRMAYYMEYSTRIYQVYLRYIAPEDIHVYSIDEVFIDATRYLDTYHTTPRELAMKMILDVLHTTGVTATAGIGSNLYLCKIALDIGAKHVKPDQNGVRIAALTEQSYREKLWTHQPITDFWRVGRGYARKLAQYGMFTMGDVARCSLGGPHELLNEDLLYKVFGVGAELLIDHAWGWEPCTIEDIKAYRPSTNSIGSGQVLQSAYTAERARLVVREMADNLVLSLVDQGLVTNQLTLTLGYDRENLTDPRRRARYHGPVTQDPYGRPVPKHAHGVQNLIRPTSSTREILSAVMALYDRIADPLLLIRRLNLTACRVVEETSLPPENGTRQLDLFADYAAQDARDEALEKEKRVQAAVLDIKKRFGKNAILKGMNFEDGATAMERNEQIGGHKA